MDTVLITGGAGFIGAHLASRLIQEGHQVIILDDFSDKVYPAWLKHERLQHLLPASQKTPIYSGSILDANFVTDIFERHDITHVFHGAAHASANVSPDEEILYTEVNVTGTLVLLQSAAQRAVKRFVLASSAAVYSDEQVPFREDSYPLHPLTVYGASKAASEVYAQMWHERHNMPVSVLRFFSAYGPWGRPDMAPMIFAHRLLTGQPILLNEEERWRDYTFVSDIVDGVTRALTTTVPFGVFNVGRGQPVRLQDFVDELERITGISPIIHRQKSPPGEMRTTYADITESRRTLGYEPRVSVRDGVESMLKWMQDWYIPTYEKNANVQPAPATSRSGV
ncbi:MAG: NAD-dependent epimerase/dehydratase family protein [Candidatus Andersenbacteria bacterium]